MNEQTNEPKKEIKEENTSNLLMVLAMMMCIDLLLHRNEEKESIEKMKNRN